VRGTGYALKKAVASPAMDIATQIHALEKALVEIRFALEDMIPTPRVNDYKAAASSYTRMVDTWLDSSPSDAQRDAVFECVMDLHSEVVAVSGVRAVANAFLAFVESTQDKTGTAG
jgi:hypothetical protein